ncbi:MAG: hypothetical protein P0S96_07450 [Simkaniaceae bacterium]|nr:hypothetical protein [Candidatus Sacchlamyda saccharinae]
MKPTALMVCKGLIPPELISLLSPDDQALIAQLPPPAPFEPEHLKWDLLNHLHYSWLAPYLRTLSEGEIRNFLAVLKTDQTAGLSKVLGLGNHIPSLSKLAKGGLRKLLLENVLQGKELVPFAFLPASPLNSLLTHTPTSFSKLIHFLGLHDLSYEMRQIIDTKELKKIFAALSKKEGEYLNTLVLHREPLVFERLFLKNWDGSKENLHKLLEERGASRLGHALYSASESLTWYITHSLDMHTGNLILKNIKKSTHARAEELLFSQIQKIESLLAAGGLT